MSEICIVCGSKYFYDEKTLSNRCDCNPRSNFTNTPADVPMPELPNFKIEKNPDYFIQKDKALILFDLVTGICIPEEGWNSDMVVYTKQLKYRLDGDEYLKFLGEYTMWRTRC